jgi:tellurite resistance protein TerC
MLNEVTFWIIFSVAVLIIFVVDLYVISHKRGRITVKASLIWSAIWVCTALLFNVLLYFYIEDGQDKALKFLTGYLIEKSLSVDNLFVFLMIFEAMRVYPQNQPRVLMWGIIGAVVFRIIFIFAGVELIEKFHAVIYAFALILLYTAYKMAFRRAERVNVEKNLLIRFARKYLNVLPGQCGRHFFITKEGKIYTTSLFVTLLLIESSDIIFAIDSIPAIIAITTDKFIIITSNIFAILGLRALYFALEGLVDLFSYLKYGVAMVLFYTGIKMLISDFYEIPIVISLGVIVTCLSAAVIFSLVHSSKAKAIK